VFRRLLPKKDGFFRDMEASSRKAVEITRALRALFEDPANAVRHVATIDRIEREADTIAHESISRLHKTFVTPLDRNEISRILKRLDDVVDLVDGAAQRYHIYGLDGVRDEAWRLLEILEKQVVVVERAVGCLSDLRHADGLRRDLIEIQALENEADEVLREALGRLFRELEDAKTLLKWKEVIERLEDATDRCEDVADLLENVILEYA